MEKEPTLNELFEDYKKYRAEESKKLSSMTEEQQVDYYFNKQKEVEKMAKEKNIKTVSFNEIFNEGND